MLLKIVTLVVLLALSGGVRAQEEAEVEAPGPIQLSSPHTVQKVESQEQEYRRMVEELNERYEDFFVHEQENKRYYEEVRRGAPEVREFRKAELRQQDVARQEHIANRQAKPDTTELERLWNADQEKDRRQAEVYRKDYVEERESVERIRNSARKIPENKDAGLE